MQRMIYDLLREGAENAIRTDKLMELTGIDTPRALRAAVARERKQGLLILSKKSDGGGYYLPSSPEEARQCVAWMEREAKSMLHAVKAARKYGNEIAGQCCIDGAEELK